MEQLMKRFIEKFKNDERGMTLVELLAVVVVLAIVGVIAFVAIGKVIDNSKKDAHVANAQQIISAVELFEASGGDVGNNVDIKNLDTLDEVLDPWSKEDNKDVFVVSKPDEGKILIKSTHEKCKFDSQ